MFWIGFGPFGGAYLITALGSPARDDLPTTWQLDALHDRPGADFDAVAAGPAHADHFRRAGHALLSLALALLGGVGAGLLFPPKRKDPGEPQPFA